MQLKNTFLDSHLGRSSLRSGVFVNPITFKVRILDAVSDPESRSPKRDSRGTEFSKTNNIT